MPLGMGYTIEGQISGKEEVGGIQIIVYDPKPGKFPDKPPRERYYPDMLCESPAAPSGMGLGAGGKMKQEIYKDEYGVETWDSQNYGEVFVHIANSLMYREITGLEPPQTPVSAKMYTEYGFPWFDLYDENKKDIVPSKILSKVKTVKQKDKQNGL